MITWAWVTKLLNAVEVVAPGIVKAFRGDKPTLDPALGESKTEQVRHDADAERATEAAAAAKNKPPQP